MKCKSQEFIVGIIVVAALLFMFIQNAEAVIGDCGKPGPDLKQSLLQDVEKINKEITILQTKLNKAREGENLSAFYGSKSVRNLKASFECLSAKLNSGKASQRSPRNIQPVSEGVSQGIVIINDLEHKVGANKKSASLQLLQKLSSTVLVLHNDINKLGPQPEPPDKGTKGESPVLNETGGQTPPKHLDVEKKMRYDRGIKETGSGIGSSAPTSFPGPTPSDEPPPKPKDDPASRGEMVETDVMPGVSESSPAPEGPVVGPGDPEKEVNK